MRKTFRDIEFADTFHKRFLGLMGRRVRPDYALVFPKCRAVHCLFMREAIDVVFLDSACTVLAVRRVEPWRMAIGPAGTAHVLECAAGEAAKHRIHAGDSLFAETGVGSFEGALEDASCWLGLNSASSCISKAYETKTHWWFASDPARHHVTYVAVSKRTGCIDMTAGTAPEKGVEEVEVPWQYSTQGKHRCA